MIPRTYHDANPEDRAYVADFWSWLQLQPQDAWLLWARCANWDSADWVFEQMVERPECDLALVAWIFWGCQPGYFVENPARYGADSLIGKIIAGVERGVYRSRALHLDRYELAINAHEYLRALSTSRGSVPFRLPRELCGPFNGRHAAIPAVFPAAVEDELQVMFSVLDGGLPRSEADYLRQQRQGGNLWIMDHLKLPKVPADPVTTYRDLDDADYVAAMFGSLRSYEAARHAVQSGGQRRRWWPF